MKRWRTEILGSLIDAISPADALDLLDSFLVQGQHHVVTPNPEFVLAARRHPEFRRIINAADLAVPDGVGLVIASRFTKIRIDHHIAGSDLVDYLLGQAASKGLPVAVVNRPDSLSPAEKIEKSLPVRYLRLRIKVFETPPSAAASESHLGSIRTFQPALLLSALGAPAQDIWISRHLDSLPTVRLAMGIGGSLDFLTGQRRRSPAWMQRAGLEWLFRLFSRPVGGRYYFGQRLGKIFRSVVVFPLIFVFTGNKK